MRRNPENSPPTMQPADIELGDTVKERLTGLSGRVIGITMWETGCSHIGVKRLGIDKDGKPWDILWFDEPNCDLVDEDASVEHAPREDIAKPGGPVPNGR